MPTKCIGCNHNIKDTLYACYNCYRQIPSDITYKIRIYAKLEDKTEYSKLLLVAKSMIKKGSR